MPTKFKAPKRGDTPKTPACPSHQQTPASSSSTYKAKVTPPEPEGSTPGKAPQVPVEQHFGPPKDGTKAKAPSSSIYKLKVTPLKIADSSTREKKAEAGHPPEAAKKGTIEKSSRLPVRTLTDEEYAEIFNAVVPTISESNSSSEVNNPNVFEAPKKAAQPLLKTRQAFRGFTKRHLSFQGRLSSSENSEDEEMPPPRHEVLKTPVYRSAKRHFEPGTDETPVSRYQKIPRNAQETEDKENTNSDRLSQRPEVISKSGSQRRSSSSSYNTASSDVSRKSPFSDISNVSLNSVTRKDPFSNAYSTPSNSPLGPAVPGGGNGSLTVSSSQESSYSVAGSLMSPLQRMAWLLPRRMVGTWVQCDSCKKWRYIRDQHDPSVFPKLWYCHMNSDVEHKTCEAAEQRLPLRDEALMISNSYAPGSLVWAKFDDYPFWPAIVDDDPDYWQFYWFDDGATEIPSQYHVVFFDTDTDTPVSRAWIKTEHLRPFAKKPSSKGKKSTVWAKRLRFAERAASEAVTMEQLERLQTYGFLARYKGYVGDLKTPARSSGGSPK